MTINTIEIRDYKIENFFPEERILPKDYPLNIGYVYIVDGVLRMCEQSSTVGSYIVRSIKEGNEIYEIRSCALIRRQNEIIKSRLQEREVDLLICMNDLEIALGNNKGLHPLMINNLVNTREEYIILGRKYHPDVRKFETLSKNSYNLIGEARHFFNKGK